MAERPKTGSGSMEKELDKVEAQLDAIDSTMKSIPIDTMNNAPIRDYEPQTKMSNREANRADAIRLTPKRSIPCVTKFNEKFRSEYEHEREAVRFIAENNEIIGESIEIWTKRFPGVPYEEWLVPVNRPVIGPRYLAEQIASRRYRRLTMKEDKVRSSDGMGTYYGTLEAEEVRQRLDARPVGNAFVSMASK